MGYNVEAVHASDSVNVLCRGVSGNGIKNDTDAILSVLNSGEKRIYFPTGTYVIKKTIDIPAGVEIFGDGEGTVFKLGANASLTEYPWRNEGGHRTMYPILYAHDNARVENLKVEGDTTEAKDMLQVGLLIGGNNIVCRNFSTENINYFPDAWIAWVSQFDEGYHAGYGPNTYCPGFGVFVFNATNVRVYGGRHIGCGYQAIGTENAIDVVVDGLYCGDTNACGLQIHRGSRRIVFANCIVNNNGVAAASDMTFHGASGDAACEDLIISDCIFGGPKGYCIHSVWGLEKNVIITGCKISSACGAGICIHSTQYSDVPIGSSAVNFTITNNIVVAGNGKKGIIYNGDYGMIANNIVYCGDVAISASGDHCEVSNNITVQRNS